MARYVSSLQVAVVAVLLGGSGCATLRMVPPGDVARQSEVFEATERSSMTGSFVDESFVLGPYQVAEVDRDWNRGSGFSVAGFSKDDTRTAYTFQFVDRAEKLPAQCTSLTERKGLSLGKAGSLSSQDARLVCTCGVGDGAARLELEDRRGDHAGRVALAGRTFDLTSVHETTAAWSPGEPAGFRVDGAEGPAAAVEVLRPGRIWLSKSLDDGERRQLACLLAGVMLYVEPTDD
ncbi:hypothetical protein [Vulgatibacter sp.]|uniref:hypothetical protein n=1 Tax=Vulgatibacter sp. TaxID=1971226 RepID=UPI003561D6F6